MSDEKSWDSPSDEYFSKLRMKLIQYRNLKEQKKYQESDVIREELIKSGVIDIDTNPRWHPIFESSESRYARLK